MRSLRSFVAVDLSPTNRSAVGRLIRKLESRVGGMRWVDPASLHLTLHFLGDVALDDIREVCDAVQRAASACESFEMHLAGAGAFPDPHHPRVVWVGVRSGCEELNELKACLDGPLGELGYPSDRKPFRPHVTIGRATRSVDAAALAEVLESCDTFEAGGCSVDQVVVYQSELERRGPKYTPIAEFDLA